MPSITRAAQRMFTRMANFSSVIRPYCGQGRSGPPPGVMGPSGTAGPTGEVGAASPVGRNGGQSPPGPGPKSLSVLSPSSTKRTP
jgi:hypothetical protein